MLIGRGSEGNVVGHLPASQRDPWVGHEDPGALAQERFEVARPGPMQPTLLGEARGDVVGALLGPIERIGDLCEADAFGPFDLEPADQFRLAAAQGPGGRELAGWLGHNGKSIWRFLRKR